MQLAERMSKIKPSATFAISSRARELRAQGLEVINFSIGEPDFHTPEHVCQAAIEAIRQGFTKYTPVGGIEELKDAIIAEFEKYYGLSYERSQVIVSCGAKHSLYNLAQVLFNPGDQVIVPAPYWVSYPDIVRLAGAEPVVVPTLEENDFKLTAAILEDHLTERCRGLILNSPSNPTGTVYSSEELAELAEVVLQHRLLVISDDIYYRILFDGLNWNSLAMLDDELRQYTIVVNGVSKTYAMTGWRIGYLAAPAEIAAAVNKIQGQNTSNPNSIAQKAALAALTGPQEAVQYMVDKYEQRRQLMLSLLEKIPGVRAFRPAGAFYVFVNCSAFYGRSFASDTIENSVDLASYLLEKAQIATVPGIAFGEDGYLRFSFATSVQVIERGLELLSTALSQLH
ncbi:MAG: pyridoxal phosphate-dependent aminotransferase [Deltaproteobacteria bacterium]|nr:pyridoxal phosphate-dependent aminotransferase [Deltaproteobacteria bacterium]MBW2069974.1 pyridoxal phosphate-dependent aminotransferase [Deltaproteobacteria bacterium]